MLVGVMFLGITNVDELKVIIIFPAIFHSVSKAAKHCKVAKYIKNFSQMTKGLG